MGVSWLEIPLGAARVAGYVVRCVYVVRSSGPQIRAKRGVIAYRMRGQRPGGPYYDCADNGPEDRTTIARTTARRTAPRFRPLHDLDRTTI